MDQELLAQSPQSIHCLLLHLRSLCDTYQGFLGSTDRLQSRWVTLTLKLALNYWLTKFETNIQSYTSFYKLLWQIAFNYGPQYGLAKDKQPNRSMTCLVVWNISLLPFKFNSSPYPGWRGDGVTYVRKWTLLLSRRCQELLLQLSAILIHK